MSSTSAPLDPQASQLWIDKAQALLDAPHLNLAEALAWPRDAAKAGAPLSREPLATLKARLAERVQAMEDLLHRAQVQREAAVLLAQRIESLSTKPWREAQHGAEGLGADVARWLAETDALSQAAEWPGVVNGVDAGGAASAGSRIAAQLEAARAQLTLVWEAFSAALVQAQAAASDANAPLPQVPVWAEELRLGRGEAATEIPLVSAQAGAAPVSAAAQARQNDPARLELIVKAEGLLHGPGEEKGEGKGGQAVQGGRKLQEALRELREQWKKLDSSAGAPHPALWKRFDDACNAARKVVQVWLDKVKAESAEHKAKRLALIDELKNWTTQHAAAESASASDWRAYSRDLHQFSERWREAGHLSEKTFAELLTRWKAAWDAAHAPLAAAQKAGTQRRQALIEEARQLSSAHAAGGALRIDEVKALQQRWQAEAQTMPLDRRQEQKLWEAFRKPIDEAFALDAERRPARGERGQGAGHGERHGDRHAERGGAASRQAVNLDALPAHDRAVFEASQALQAASASGDAQAIHAAMAALEAARRASAGAAAPAASAAPAEAAPSATGEPEAADTAAAAKPAAPRKPVLAVRGDDRPGAKKTEPAPAAFAGRRGDRAPGRDDRRGGRDRDMARGGPQSQQPRLGDAAFRAQRDALEHAQAALKKLAAQAHGEALTRLLDAWAQRAADQLPSVQELGRAVAPATRVLWNQALSSPAKGDGAELLLRLEMAAEAPTPAEHLAARRALQLQLLTRRNDPAPAQTWGQDVARVLGTSHTPESARRLQQALKVLLRG